jgi:prevent-host-death family protein
MTGKIGVRELKNRASEIVREVHEQAAEFIVTLRGEPVAVIRPLTEKGGRALLQAEEDEALAEVDRLAEKIALAWRSPKSAAELLEEQRR